ncbi:DUF3696 domain-containing protein [Mesorhizobium sp. M0296]|uniref:AAA family ATPase n=1 Tax=Mesorhizobium sp. M0296 TaxID=2956931 RepID=UPI0033350FA4
MIKYLRLRNFRAYRDQSFNFSRLNIFIGANNSGKSSIISAINLLAQTHAESRGSTSPLILNGPYEELGTFQDIVHGNNVRTPIGFDFGIGDFHVSFDVKYRLQRRELEIAKFTLLEGDNEIVSYQTKKDKVDVKIKRESIESVMGNKNVRRPRFTGFWPFIPEVSFLAIRNSDLPKSSQKIIEQASRSLRMAEMRIRDSFRFFDTLSPFRAQPQRTYVYSGETPNEIGRTGANGVSLLVNDTSKRGAIKIGLEEEISEWLKANKIASAIKVKNLTSRHFEICLVDFKGKEHNVCDVGFGCSQVLPVLVGGLNLFHKNRAARSSPTFVVQEPEIHLHPNAQASLGSFFVGLARYGGQQFIETHSDNLVLRVARHVALGDIDSKDIKLFFVEDSSGEKIVTELAINPDGVFDPNWPGGFFPQRQFESLQLAKARTHTARSRSDHQLRFTYPE